MNIHLIKTEADYEKALARIDQLLNAEYGTPECDELELLSILVEKYEKEHFPILPPDPIEAIKYKMEQMGLSQKDIASYIGQRSHVSEVLSGKRPLSLKMIVSLNKNLGIPLEILVGSIPAKTVEKKVATP